MTKTKTKKAKKVREPEKYWNELIHILFKFYSDNLMDIPTFDADQPRSFRMIIVALRTRVEHSKLEWTQERAEKMLKVFLEWAFADPWLHDNFLLFNLNRQKDKIFFRIKQYQLSKQNQ